MYRARLGFLFLLVLLVVLAMGIASTAPAQPKQPKEVKESEKLRQAVTPGGILVHELRLQGIADRNDNTRASGTPGYDESASYVADQLRKAGYNVTVQPFSFRLFTENSPSELQQTSPTPTTYVNGQNFATMEYSGSGNVTAAVQAVDTDGQPNPGTSTSGCEAEDFAGFTRGNIALMQRGTCPFAQKAENAENAGAAAALIFNRGTGADTGVINGTLGADSDVAIPALGLDYQTGRDLADPGTTARVFTDTKTETKQTSNVLADTPKGKPDNTLIVGAHLDSVAEGPGINDNGSGTSTILETAIQMSKLKIKPRNKVRFAFWGAEESGLIGSTYYVNTLPDEEFNNIALNLNFDMVGSPNYVRFVYDGDASDTPSAGSPGSAAIEQTFLTYFDSQGLETDPTAFDGRSDYRPFILAGIPAGGLFTGAEGTKTAQQAAIYGGTAGIAYDPCYHQACDDMTNLNVDALDEMSDATAHATLTYANAKRRPGEPQRGESSRVSQQSLGPLVGSHLIE